MGLMPNIRVAFVSFFIHEEDSRKHIIECLEHFGFYDSIKNERGKEE